MLGIPPIVPKIDAIIVLDGDGNRLAAKYYDPALTGKSSPSSVDIDPASNAGDAQTALEQSVHLKAVDPRTGVSGAPGTGWVQDGITPAAGIAEVGGGRVAVFCPGAAGAAVGDTRIITIGPAGESELMLAHMAECLYGALHALLRGALDRHIVLDNLELVLLLIDELCDGGIALEVDTSKLVSSVLLRDDDCTTDPAVATASIPVKGLSDMTISQAFMQARDQFVSTIGNRDAM